MRDDTTMVLGIGAPRAGTTWLAAYLGSHPQFYMSPLKELHYFDARYLPEQCAGFDHAYTHALLTLGPDLGNIDHVRMRVDMIDDPGLYLKYFERFMGQERCFGEISPAYCLLDRAMVREVAALHPRVRFVYLLRNPVDRFISNAFHMVEFLDMASRDPDRFVQGALRSEHLLCRADYRRTIEHYQAGATDRILYLFYEELFHDAAMRRLCDFCGLDFRPGAYDRRHNASKTQLAARVGETVRGRIYRRLAGQYAFVHEFFRGDLPESWRRDMARYAHLPPDRTVRTV